MDDLISRQAAIEVVDAVWSVTGDKNVAKVWDQIKDLPSAQPVVHAHWIKTDEGHESFYDNTWVEYLVLHCSSCNGMVREGEKFRYCPFCGAKMDEEEGK